MSYFVIKEKLPSLNEYVNACRTNAFKGAKFKEETETLIFFEIREAIIKKTLQYPKNYPIELKIEWHERTRRRDVDNIQSAKKFILDAMKTARVINDDSRKYISQIHDEVIDDTIDFVKVEIIENQEEKQ